MKPNGFFFFSLPLFFAISAHSIDIPGVQSVNPRGGGGSRRHCFSRHKRRKRRTLHSLWWATCSCVGSAVTRHEAAVKSHFCGAIYSMMKWRELCRVFFSHICTRPCVPPTSPALRLRVTDRYQQVSPLQLHVRDRKARVITQWPCRFFIFLFIYFFFLGGSPQNLWKQFANIALSFTGSTTPQCENHPGSLHRWNIPLPVDGNLRHNLSCQKEDVGSRP